MHYRELGRTGWKVSEISFGAWAIGGADGKRHGALKMVGIPFTLNGTPAAIRRPPPTLGQHTDEVLRDELGYSAERIAALRAEKVV